MVKVEMPRASWEIVLVLMSSYFGVKGDIIHGIAKEISDQVYSQEY